MVNNLRKKKKLLKMNFVKIISKVCHKDRLTFINILQCPSFQTFCKIKSKTDSVTSSVHTLSPGADTGPSKTFPNLKICPRPMLLRYL